MKFFSLLILTVGDNEAISQDEYNADNTPDQHFERENVPNNNEDEEYQGFILNKGVILFLASQYTSAYIYIYIFQCFIQFISSERISNFFSLNKTLIYSSSWRLCSKECLPFVFFLWMIVDITNPQSIFNLNIFLIYSYYLL